MKILICEDEEILLTALEFRMRKVGMDVVLAKDGQEAFQKIATERPDLIVADIEMPKLSGIQLIEKVRQSEHKHLPIIVISALDHEDDILEAFRKGANDFVAKPFKPAELVLRVKRILLV
ncbi:MAG: response regulator [Saprospiraceae bacterium]|nr:response regulator [Saprospiraceae bacterium]